MARLLQMLTGDTRQWCCVWFEIGLICSMLALAGCILPPDLPEYEEDQVPPYIVPGEVEPPNRIVTAARPEPGEDLRQTFEVLVRDRNQHERLDWVILSSTRGNFGSGSAAASTQPVEVEGELFFEYFISVKEVLLCDDPPEGRIETVTLYVADQELETLPGLEPPQLVDLDGDGETDDEGHIISHTWLLEYTPDACN